MRQLLLLIATAALLHANALDALRARLGQLEGRSPVRAIVEYSYTSREGDDTTTESGKASAVAQEDPSGLSLFWSRAVLDKAEAEMVARSENPEVKTPTRRVLQSMDVERVHEYFDAATGLLRRLEGAELLGEAPASFEGKPARLVTLSLKPKLSAHDRKYVKQADVTAKIWTDDTGIPLAAETVLSVKGRALLVISFETAETERLRFAVRDGRLVVTRHEKETSGSGAGEQSRQTSLTVLTYEGIAGLRRVN